MGKHSSYKSIGAKHYYANQNGLIIFRKRFKGKMMTISTGKSTLLEAEKVVSGALGEKFASANRVKDRKKKGITNPLISEIWLDCIDERKSFRSKHTLENYNTSWKYSIEPFWGDLTLTAITDERMNEFEAWFLKKRPGKTYYNVHKHLGMLLRFMRDKGMIQKVPKMQQLDEIIHARIQKEKVGRVYTSEEISSLIKESVNLRTKIAILIFRYMGPRKMEALSSKKEKWDLKTNRAQFWSAKNKKWRTVPIPLPVREALREWSDKPSVKDSEYLFPADSNSETHISSQVFDREWTETKRRAGISGWNVPLAARIHDLRHTFATQTNRDKWSIIDACNVLDMTVKEYQRTYVHTQIEDIEASMKKSFGRVKS